MTISIEVPLDVAMISDVLESASSRHRAWVNWGIVVGLMVVTAIPYAHVGEFEFVALDDQQYVVQSELVRQGLDPLSMWGALTEFHADNWHPLVWWSLMLDVQLFGLNPGPFHLVNLVWHLINVALLFAAMQTLSGDRWRSAIVAAVFGVHPLHVESVAWVTERKDVLSGFFWMLGLWAYARWCHTRQSRWWWLVTGCLIAGLMSKQILITFPCVLLLLDGWPLGRWQDLRLGATVFRRAIRLVKEKLVWFGLCVGAVLIVLQAQTQAREFAADWPLSLRLSNAALSVMRYLGKTVWPVGLAVPYPYNPPVSMTPVYAAAAGIAVLTLIAIVVVRRHPFGLVGWLWFLGVLAPVSGLVQAGQQSMADRYMYLPLIGLSVAVVWMIPTPRSRGMAWFWGGIVTTCLLALTVRSGQQVTVWKNSDTLFRHALVIDPTNDSAHFILAAADLQAGRLAEGIAHLQPAVKWEQKRWMARHFFRGTPKPERVAEMSRWWGDLYFQIGQAQVKLQQPTAAILSLREAIQNDPTLVEAKLLLGESLADTGDFAAARVLFQEVLRRNPGHPAAQRGLSQLPRSDNP